MITINDVRLVQFKLYSFKDDSKREEFINHLDNVSTCDNNITFVVAGDSVIIECTMTELAYIYYTSFENWANSTNILITVPDDCEYTNQLSQWDCEQLEMKRMIKM